AERRRMLHTEIVGSFPRLEDLSTEWNRLWMTNPQREIFGHFGWARAMWKAHGAHRTLCTPLVFDAGRLVAILPLASDRGTLRFLGSPGSDYNDILCEPTASPELLLAALDALDGELRSWKYGLLENLLESSQIIRMLGGIGGSWSRRIHLTP